MLGVVLVVVVFSLVPAGAGAGSGWCQDLAVKMWGRTVVKQTTLCVPPCIYGWDVDLECSYKKTRGIEAQTHPAR
jgi:hypothetical protein